MGTEELGRQLLREVEVVDIGELIQEARISAAGQTHYSIGIPQIDQHLRLSINQRPVVGHRQDASSDAVHRTSEPRKERKPVLELTATAPGAGRTHLLYVMTTLSILPDSHYGKELGGSNSAVVVIDTDGHFDIDRLYQVARAMVSSSMGERTPISSDRGEITTGQPGNDEDCHELIRSALRHVHVFRPQSLSSLVATVESLESYLLDATSHFSGERRLGSIIIDSASTFYWQHRDEEEALRLQKVEGGQTRASGDAALPKYSQLLRALRQAQQLFDCAVVYTTHSSAVSHGKGSFAGRSFDSASATPEVRPYLPPSWSMFPTIRLLLERASVRPFPVGMGAGDAWAERDMRWDVIRKGRFAVNLLLSNGSTRTCFDFVINGDGVRI